MIRRASIPVLALAAATLASPRVAAQVVPVDDGVFVLYRNDTVLGEERVTLHRMGLGQDARFIGQSEVRLGDGTEMRPRLEAALDMRPTTYQNKFTGPETGEVMLSRAGRRLVARVQTASGEAQREFRATGTTLILEPEVVLLYYFLRPWVDSPGAELTVLDPRAGAQQRFTLSAQGSEELRIGRFTVMTTRIRLQAGSDLRDIWFDDEGRVIRVQVPATGFRAERQAL
jgi:hypothetical protein